MRSLRTRLLFSHLLLVAIMAVVMAAAAVNFLRLGRSIDRILKDNYKSVVAAQNMKEALERQDSAATFFLAGQVDKARAQYETFRPRFDEAYRIEATNITERGEQAISDDIGRRSRAFRSDMERLLFADPPLPSAEARALYFQTLEPRFAGLKRRAQDVLDLNQAAILRADRRAKVEARAATWISIGTTAFALALAVGLALRTIRAALTPLVSLARQAEEIGAGHLNQAVTLRRDDEIGALAAAFNAMAERLRTARAQLEERLGRAERMSDAALENLYDPVVVTDAAGRVVHLNRAAEGLFGPEGHAVGRAVAEVVGETRIAHAVERAIRQKQISAEEGDAAFIPLAIGDGAAREERTYRLRTTPMRGEENRTLGAVAVLEDVTHLREVDRLKTEFIGVASHELRTPVTSLLLSSDLLAEGFLTPEQAEIVAAQRQDLERLERMMRDLLDVTRLEAGATPPRFGIVAVPDLIHAAVGAVRARAESDGVALSIAVDDDDALPKLRADRGQLTRVLVNLLNNALRHTPRGGAVTVSAAREPGTGRIAIAVADTGSGIPAGYLEHIFERFAQVPGATRGGSGLGLSIARTIVAGHGGTITAASTVGRGSTFTVRLPEGK